MELSKERLTSAIPKGSLLSVPLKITSCISEPRKDLTDCSPKTQRIESKILDFPHPLGPSSTCSVPQVILRWIVQRRATFVAKSTHAERLRANLDIFGFALTDDEMAAVAALDKQQPNAGFTHQDPRMLQRLLQLD